MANTCVVGLQWGDEAKGKIVDLLCDVHDVVVRYQGGANAGHTVMVGDKTYKLSLVPTGAVRHSAWVSGATELSVMLLDVLSGFDEIKVAVAYERPDGSRLDWFPGCLEELGQVKPIYVTMPGWAEDVTAVKQWADFPENFKRYVAFLAEQVGVPVKRVSVGPERTQTVAVAD